MKVLHVAAEVALVLSGILSGSLTMPSLAPGPLALQCGGQEFGVRRKNVFVDLEQALFRADQNTHDIALEAMPKSVKFTGTKQFVLLFVPVGLYTLCCALRSRIEGL